LFTNRQLLWLSTLAVIGIICFATGSYCNDLDADKSRRLVDSHDSDTKADAVLNSQTYKDAVKIYSMKNVREWPKVAQKYPDYWKAYMDLVKLFVDFGSKTSKLYCGLNVEEIVAKTETTNLTAADIQQKFVENGVDIKCRENTTDDEKKLFVSMLLEGLDTENEAAQDLLSHMRSVMKRAPSLLEKLETYPATVDNPAFTNPLPLVVEPVIKQWKDVLKRIVSIMRALNETKESSKSTWWPLIIILSVVALAAGAFLLLHKKMCKSRIHRPSMGPNDSICDFERLTVAV